MSKLSRRKGANFELELCRLFKSELGIPELRRRLSQWQDSDEGDILVEPFLIEAKRYKEGNWFKRDWWEQCKRAAIKHDCIPLLIYRYDRQEMRFVFPIYAINSEWGLADNQFSWPTQENALRPLVCDADTGLSIMREWLVA